MVTYLKGAIFIFPYLINNIVVVEGYDAYGIYDLNNEKFFRVSKSAGRFLSELSGQKNFGEYSEMEQNFIEQAKEKGIVEYSKFRTNIVHTKLEDVLKRSRELKFAWLELTSQCNHNCLHCFLGEDLNRYKPFELDKVYQYIDILNDKGISQLIFSGGEPFLHPNIGEIINYVSKYPINTTILTNGTTSNAIKLAPLIKEKDVKIKLSILGKESTHDRIVGVKGSFSKLMKTCALYKDMGIDFEFGYTVNDLNKEDVEDIKRFADELEIFIEFSPLYSLGNATKNKELLLNSSQKEIIKKCQVNKSSFKKTRINNNSKRPILKSDYEAVDLKNILTDSHECGQKVVAIQCSGLLSPCLLIRDPKMAIGNANETSLDDLLNYEYKSRWGFNSLVKINAIEECKGCEAKFICKGGGCLASSYSVYKDFSHKNPYYSKCFYKNQIEV